MGDRRRRCEWGVCCDEPDHRDAADGDADGDDDDDEGRPARVVMHDGLCKTAKPLQRQQPPALSPPQTSSNHPPAIRHRPRDSEQPPQAAGLGITSGSEQTHE